MNLKHIAFCDEYLINGMNATQAYLSVYKNVKNENTAKANGCRLLTYADVQTYIADAQSKSSHKLEITRESILLDLQELKIDNKTINPSISIKALDLQIKMLGFNAPLKTETKLSGNINLKDLLDFED